MRLKEPYWSAWRKYGWEPDTYGYGLSKNLIRTADLLDKKIAIHVDNAFHEATTKKLIDYYKENKTDYEAKRETPVIVFPYTLFKKVNLHIKTRYE